MDELTTPPLPTAVPRLAPAYRSMADMVCAQYAVTRIEAAQDVSSHVSDALMRARPKVDVRGQLTLTQRTPLAVPLQYLAVQSVSSL
jgi:hypothetical protein